MAIAMGPIRSTRGHSRLAIALGPILRALSRDGCVLQGVGFAVWQFSFVFTLGVFLRPLTISPTPQIHHNDFGVG
jgi:hypothetical protein